MYGIRAYLYAKRGDQVGACGPIVLARRGHLADLAGHLEPLDEIVKVHQRKGAQVLHKRLAIGSFADGQFGDVLGAGRQVVQFAQVDFEDTELDLVQFVLVQLFQQILVNPSWETEQ